MELQTEHVVEIFADFDGTLTSEAGRDLVFSDFYKTLHLGENPDANYSYSRPLISIEKIKEKMQQEFGNNESDERRLNRGAKKFLETMLKNKNAGVTIISRNQTNYIKALLELEGLNDDQIDKINIVDVSVVGETAPKTDPVRACLKNKSPESILIYDDNEADANSMEVAAKENFEERGLKPNVSKMYARTGCFDWEWNLRQASKKLNSPQKSGVSGVSFNSRKRSQEYSSSEEENEDNNNTIPRNKN